MTAITVKGREPPKSNAPNSENQLEPFLENGMIMRVEGCAEVQRDKPLICLTNRQSGTLSTQSPCFDLSCRQIDVHPRDYYQISVFEAVSEQLAQEPLKQTAGWRDASLKCRLLQQWHNDHLLELPRDLSLIHISEPTRPP